MKLLVFLTFFLFQSCTYPQFIIKEKYANIVILVRYYPSDQALKIKDLTSVDFKNQKNILNQWELDTLRSITNNKGTLEITCTSFPEIDRTVGRVIFVMQKYTEHSFSINKLMKGCMICYQVDDAQWNVYMNQVQFQDKRFTLRKSKESKNVIDFEEEYDDDSIRRFNAFVFD